jgi:hypothetical protein
MQVKCTDMERDLSQARGELERLKEVMGRFGTIASLFNPQKFGC